MSQGWFALTLSLLLTCGFSAAAQQDDSASPGTQLTPAERFANALDLRQRGELSAALAALDQLRAEYPADVDYSLARAQVLASLDRNEAALAELRAATRMAPDYEAVWQLRHRLLIMRGDRESLDELAALRDSAAARFPDADWWQKEVPDESRRWLLLLGAGYDNLSGGLPSWNNQFVELQYEHDPSQLYRLLLGRNARYSSADTTVGLGAEFSWPSGWLAGTELSSASGPDYLPELAFAAHVGKALDGGWVLDLRYQRRDYEAADVDGWVGSIEKYAGDFRYAYSLGRSRLDRTSGLVNHRIATDWYYASDASIGVTISAGDEAESLADGRVLESRVKAASLNGRRGVTERIELRWWLGVSEQGDFYRRRFLGLAIAVQL